MTATSTSLTLVTRGPRGHRPEPRARSLTAASFSALAARLVVIAGLGAAAVMLLIGRLVLPTKYFNDDAIIQSIAQGHPLYVPDQSYQRTGDVYRWLGLADQPLLTSVLIFCAFCVVLVIAARSSGILSGRLGLAVFVGASAMACSLYVAFYSKEALLLPLAALFVAVPSRRWGQLLLLTPLLVYAASVRSYWFLIAILYVVLLLALQRLGRRVFAVLPLLLLIGIGLAFHAVLGVNSDHFREAANAARIGVVDTNTLIHPVLSVSALPTDLANTVLEWAFLIVPLPLLLTLSPLYVFAGLAVTAMWVWVGRRVWVHLALPARERPIAFARMAALVLALLLVQSFFEPDYGSCLRHLAPVLPVFLGLLALRVRHVQPASTQEAGARAHALARASR